MNHLKEFLNHVAKPVTTKISNIDEIDGVIEFDEWTQPVGGQNVHIWMVQYGEEYHELTYITIGEEIWEVNDEVIDQVNISIFLCRVEDYSTK